MLGQPMPTVTVPSIPLEFLAHELSLRGKHQLASKGRGAEQEAGGIYGKFIEKRELLTTRDKS